MAVTRESYVAVSPWNAEQLAGLFEQAFIDAGYMTAWFDSFQAGGIANRILEITYSPGKLYGKAYYWFQFSNNTWHYSVATGWNAITHVPIGTQWTDFKSSNPAVNTGQLLIATANTLTTITLTRWTSGIDPNFSYFLLKNGTSEWRFHINLAPPVGWIDLDKVLYHSMGWFRIGTNNGGSWLRYTHYGMAIRRSWIATGVQSNAWHGENITNRSLTLDHGACTHGYFIPGEVTSNMNGFGEHENIPQVGQGVYLPLQRSNTSNSFTTIATPIFSNLLLSLYSSGTIPSDFGYTGYSGSRVMAPFDQYIVTPTSEVWDVIDVVNTTQTTGALSTLILARMV